MVLLLSENHTTNMNSYSENNITTSLENSRNSLRRIARNDDTEFSHQSILNVMERFVKTVNTMDDTILVPRRLMDLKVGDESDPVCLHTTKNPKKNAKPPVQKLLNAADLYDIYDMLHTVKDGLLWGQSASEEAAPVATPAPAVVAAPAPAPKGHVRRPSTVSVASTNSSTSTMSDTESEAGSTNEIDSGIDETSPEGYYANAQTRRIATDFKSHLDGLTTSLKQMTDVAQYLTWRYQHDIGGPV